MNENFLLIESILVKIISLFNDFFLMEKLFSIGIHSMNRLSEYDKPTFLRRRTKCLLIDIGYEGYNFDEN